MKGCTDKNMVGLSTRAKLDAARRCDGQRMIEGHIWTRIWPLDEDVAVEMVAVVADEVQAPTEPVVVVSDTSNPDQAGRISNNNEGNQTRTHT